MLAYADATMLLPDQLDYEQAAPLSARLHGLVGATLGRAAAERATRRRRHRRPGPSRRAIREGCRVHDHSRLAHSPAKDKLIRELGADEIVRDGKGLAAAGGADVVLGTSNSVDAMADSMAGLRPDGRLVLMGFENKPLPVHPGDLLMHRIRVLGSQQNSREYLYEALQIAATGKVRVMTETYSLDEITKAYERVENGLVRFRAVVTFS